MFDKMLLLILTGSIWGTLTAAELKISGNQITANKTRITMFKNSTITLLNPKLGMFSRLTPHFTTKAPGTWFSLTNAKCQTQMKRNAGKFWSYTANVPLNAANKTLPVKMQVNPTPFDTIEVGISYEPPAPPQDLREFGLFMNFPLKKFHQETLVLNGKKIPVVNKTQYGWYKTSLTNPKLTLFAGQPDLELSLSFEGKYDISIGSVQNGDMTIRFNANEKEINYTITTK